MTQASPVLRRVLEGAQAFRAGSVTAEELQLEVSAAMSAVEGDVPRSVRDGLRQLEARIDSARFTGGRIEILDALDEFDGIIRDADAT